MHDAAAREDGGQRQRGATPEAASRAALYCGGVSTQVTIVGGGSYQWAPGADGRPLRDAGAGRHAPRARGHRPGAAAQDGGAGPQAQRGHGRQGHGRHHDRPAARPSTAPTSSSCASRPAASAPWRSTWTCRRPTASRRRSATPSGPGGINRALRNIPVLVGIGKAMEERCPDAWLFNITNPMTAPDPRGVPGDRHQDGRASATRSATSAWTWPSPWAGRSRRSRPR